MDDQNLEEKANDHHDEKILLIIIKSTIVRVSFRIITLTLLALLLPLAFLHLAKIVFSRFLLLSQVALIPIIPLSSSSSSQYPNHSYLHTTNLAILYLIVSTLSLATLLHTLTNNKLTTTSLTTTTTTLGNYVAWILLLTMQVSIGLGLGNNDLLSLVVEGNKFSSVRTDRTLYSKAIFFLGLHETMIRWSSLVVEPVINDTSFGVVWRRKKEEEMVKRVLMSIGFWCLWCYLGLREEVEALVFVAEVKWELILFDNINMNLEMADFVGWWLYYMTVMIGVVKDFPLNISCGYGRENSILESWNAITQKSKIESPISKHPILKTKSMAELLGIQALELLEFENDDDFGGTSKTNLTDLNPYQEVSVASK
ncbi:hypothetical protein CsatA_028094 [Cannabis sativa]